MLCGTKPITVVIKIAAFIANFSDNRTNKGNAGINTDFDLSEFYKFVVK